MHDNVQVESHLLSTMDVHLHMSIQPFKLTLVRVWKVVFGMIRSKIERIPC